MTAEGRRLETMRHIAGGMAVALIICLLIEYVGPKFGYVPSERPALAYE